MEKPETCEENKPQNAFESILEKQKQNFGKDFATRWLEANLKKTCKLAKALPCKEANQLKEQQI